MSGRESEEWTVILSWAGMYEASNLGRVRSLNRVTTSGARVKGRMLRPHVQEAGYEVVTLSQGGESRRFLVHRLVLEAFRGPAPDGMEACHCDGDRRNNRLINLRWDTHLSNMRDRFTHGTNDRINRTHCPRGHSLASPNLRQSSVRRGRRECLACDLERKKAARDGRPFSHAEADLRFAGILDGRHDLGD